MKGQSPMRILLVTWNYPPKVGGMERILEKLVQNLRYHANVHVFAPYAVQEDMEEQQEITRSKRGGLVWFTLYALYSCISLLNENNYDVIIGGSALVAPLVFILGRIFRLPIAVVTYGLDIIYPHPFYQWMIKRLLPRYDRIFAISRATREEVLKRGVPASCITIIHPGLDFSDFEIVPDIDVIRKKYGFEDRLILLCVGRLARRKGQLDFVKYSLPSIVEKFPNTLLLLVGANPTQSLSHKDDIATQIDNEIKRLGLDEHVRMMGKIDWTDRQKLIELYYVCDAFILPAIRVPGDMEGFGIVFTEANAAGKPVVSTKLGGITDAVIDGKTGILVEPGKWDEMSDAILALLADESLRQKMGQFGRERAKKELDWSIIASQYLVDIEMVIDKNS